jgi:hypothetical protein
MQIRSGKRSRRGVEMDYYLVQQWSLGLLYVFQAWSSTDIQHFFIYPFYLLLKLPQHRVPFVASVCLLIPLTVSVLMVDQMDFNNHGGRYSWPQRILGLQYVSFSFLTNADNEVEYEKIRHIYSRTDVGRLPPRTERGQKVKTS